MQKTYCDAKGEEAREEAPEGRWEITLTWFQRETVRDSRCVDLCGNCGARAAKLLGFGTDKGKIISLAQDEYAWEGESSYRPNTSLAKPEALPAAAMRDNDKYD